VSTLLGFLKLLLYWLATCPSVLGSFATSPVMIPLAIDLTCLDGRCGPFCRTQIEGLACLVMGACIKAEHTEADVTALMSLIARRVGIEAYQHKVESLWRSEALQRPPRGLAEFRCYNGHYRIFVREQQRAVQRRMVQLYVAEGSGGGGLSEDVAEHYKQLIRVQDADLREVRHENEQLRSEVEAFMKRTLKASSAALADKADALEMENKALHLEVNELQQELDQRVGRLEQERQKLRVAVSELELQLQSMAVSYGQVEQNNAELRAAIAALSSVFDNSDNFATGEVRSLRAYERVARNRFTTTMTVEFADNVASEKLATPPQASNKDRARYELQFYKTRQCSFFEKGKCNRGSNCKYAHGISELQARPDLSFTSLCRKFAATGVCDDPACSFAHNPEQLRATKKFFKTSLCKFHLNGRCRLGEECRHAHGEHELLQAPQPPQKVAIAAPPGLAEPDVQAQPGFDLSQSYAASLLLNAAATGGNFGQSGYTGTTAGRQGNWPISSLAQKEMTLQSDVGPAFISLSPLMRQDAAAQINPFLSGSAESVAKSLAVLGQPFCVPLLQPSCPFMSNKNDVHHHAVSHFFMSKRFCA
ncbi:unnamed protein product, partial [Symbiodinium necroappetens]